MSALLEHPAGHPAAVAVAEIGAVLDAVSGSSLWSLPDGDLQEVTVAAGRIVNRVQALLVRLVGEVDSRELGLRSGASTTAGWVRHRLGVTLREANQLAAVAAATRTRLSV
ncbi:MAG: hypothetical protein ACR2KO_05175 [Geodermatophilaceae bacterium]